jgi:hypothetical protein
LDPLIKNQPSPTAKTALLISLVLATCSPRRKADRSTISSPPPNPISPALCQSRAPAAVAAWSSLRPSRAVVSRSTLRHRSGSTPHDLTAVDRRSYWHQPLSQALDRQRPRSRQVANFIRPHTENVAPQRTIGTPIAVLTGRTIVPTTSIQIH